ncbi:MAG TPA: glycosyltransferase family 2 protein [bacterium]|jgi:hypothetical protein
MNDAPEPRRIVVGIVVLNYNGEKVLPPLFESLEKLLYPDFRVFLVDNASSDKSLEYVKSYSAGFDMEVIENQQNLLFSGGNNVGIKRALEWGADYVLLLNNDTIVSPSMLDTLVEFMAGTANRGGGAIAGPLIYFNKPEGHIWYAGGYVNRWLGTARHRGIRQKDVGQYGFLELVDYVSGCAMCVKKKVFEKIGYLDESFPMYYEDTDFCLRAKNEGFDTYYVPTEPMIHLVSVAAGGQLSGFKIMRRFRAGMKFFARHAKWYQWPTIILGQLIEAVRIMGLYLSGKVK